MDSLYQRDLAYIQATGFGGLARRAAPEIIRLLKSASIQVHRVFEIGCGAGPLTGALTEAGFNVTAIDTSAELLKFARRSVPRARFVHGSAYETQIPTCEAIVASGEPLTYHPEPERADSLVQNFFRAASATLPSGGLLIFDTIELGEPSLERRHWSSGEDWAVLSETEEDQCSRTLIRRIHTFRRIRKLYRRACETHRVRLFETSTLLCQLADTGFSTETATAYGAEQLGPRRRAFFCRRLERR